METQTSYHMPEISSGNCLAHVILHMAVKFTQQNLITLLVFGVKLQTYHSQLNVFFLYLAQTD